MKLNKYFMLGLAGLAFAACSNEDGLPGNGDDGSAKSLIISISGISSSAGKTRALRITLWMRSRIEQNVPHMLRLM